MDPEGPPTRPSPEPQSGQLQPGHESAPPVVPSWYGQPFGQVDLGRNGFSIAGLVLGIIPVTAGMLGIIFGLIGRSQSKRRGQKGRVMGTWGAVLGATWLTIILVIAVHDSLDDAQRDNNGQVIKPGQESAFSLQVGDCLRSIPGDVADVEEVNLVPCASTHKAEVFADIDLTYSSYPGGSVIAERSEALCKKAFEPFVGLTYNESTLDLFFLYPTARSWRAGDRTVTCLVSGPHLVGTAKGARR
jgi:hypothetical protein